MDCRLRGNDNFEVGTLLLSTIFRIDVHHIHRLILILLTHK
jgi:hypothetical protein